MSNPILVNTLRGELIENCHRGAIAVCAPNGRLVHSRGDVDALVYPRSAIKALQALPLVESAQGGSSGVAQRFRHVGELGTIRMGDVY